MGKKTERQKIISLNDDIFRKIIRLRDNCTCQITGLKVDEGEVGSYLDVCHYITRSILQTRWDYENCILARKGINCNWMNKYRGRYRAWMVGRIGKEAVEKLELFESYYIGKRGTIHTSDLKLITMQLKKRLAEFKSQKGIIGGRAV